MKVFFYRVTLIFSLVVLYVEYDQLSAQCNPSPAETCEDASVFCSLDQMNGYTCNNPSTIQGTCRPLCAVCCPPTNNRTWWAFICQGGNVSITLNVGPCNCTMCASGIVMGIWSDCKCQEVMCEPNCIHPGNSITYNVNLVACKKYYLTIDECCGCICDFTLNTSGGGPPTLSPLGYINNIQSGIIQPVCIGACDYKFFVNPQQGSCADATYVWTLDGVELIDDKNETKLDFPVQGDFVLCVTAYLGNPKNGSVCAQEGPKCATIKVRPIPDKVGKPRTLCYEAANPVSYRWHSQYISTSGIYKEHYTESNCCMYDSVVEFIVLPEIVPKEILFISCDTTTPFIDKLGRKYFSCLNHYEIDMPKSTDIYKCDSVISLTAISVDYSPQWQALCAGNKVELAPNISILKKCSIGETYNFDYKWYKKNDTLQKAISTEERLLADTINEDYCLEVKLKVLLGPDSAFCVKTFCETINESESGNSIKNIFLSFCDSAIVNGQAYTQSTKFTQQLKNVFGCDSIIVTDLNISKSSSSSLILNYCDSAMINGKVYYQSGSYTHSFINANNCDSMLHIDLTIAKSNKTNLTLSACDSMVINGKTYYQSGLYPEMFQNVDLCDSLVNLDLTIYKTRRDSLSFNDCDKIFYNGKIYTKTGDYPESYIGINGCDSIVNIHINITNSNTSPLKLTKCDSVTINGTYYDQSGSYTQILTSANGCDSTLNIDLTIGKKSSFNYKLTSCDSVLINGKWYYQSGFYNQTLQNVNQCDSTLNIDLKITESTTGDTLFRSCDSVKINGQIYKQTGIYKQTLINSIQCDSILIIDFTRLSKSSTNLNYKSCDSVLVNKQIYKQSGIYTQTLSNINQCDSLINLDITITKSNSSDSISVGCDSLTFNGQTYFQSGNYSQSLTNADLCDSTLFLNLTINKSSLINYSTKACDVVNINGQIFNQSGSYTQYLKDIHQCDSTVHIQLTLNKSDSSSLSKNACDSFEVNNMWYYNTGLYKQNLLTVNGCDSTITFDLTIKPGNPSALVAGTDTSICEGEVIKLNGNFSGLANFTWHSASGNFDNPNSLNTNYYSSVIGDERIYLQAADDCKQWLDSLAIRVLPSQIVQVTGDTILNPCKEIRFTASGGTNYKWTPSSFIDCLDPPCSRVLLKSTTATRFTISTDGPCAVPANLNLSLVQIQTDVYLPNVFSPNGDNINDVFLPVFNCEQVDYYSLQIFDRWGNLVFESQNKDKGWNGKYQDVPMNPGVYPYVMQYQLHGSEKKLKFGDLTLVR